jgi:hypothetical protein
MPEEDRAVLRAVDAEGHRARRQAMPEEDRAVLRAVDAERHQINYDEARNIVQPRLLTSGSARANTIDEFHENTIGIHRLTHQYMY